MPTASSQHLFVFFVTLCIYQYYFASLPLTLTLSPLGRGNFILALRHTKKIQRLLPVPLDSSAVSVTKSYKLLALSYDENSSNQVSIILNAPFPHRHYFYTDSVLCQVSFLIVCKYRAFICAKVFARIYQPADFSLCVCFI